MLISTDDITIASFPKLFDQIIEEKQKVGLTPIQNNPSDLLERAKMLRNAV